jgi:hypothetical protein
MSQHFLSSESIDSVIHTAIYSRVEKIEVLAAWPPAYDNLRVCQAWDKNNVDLNCSWCWKCLATMIHLDILGVYKKFTSFEQPYNKLATLRFLMQPYLGAISASEIMQTAKKYNRFGILFWFYLFYFPNKFRSWLMKKTDHVLSDKNKYRIRERLYRKRVFDLPQDSSPQD